MGQRLQFEAADNQALSQNLHHEAARRNELLKRLITTQEDERRRVARDLHDDLGQDLAGLATSLEAAERLWADRPEQAWTQLRQARALIAGTAERAYAMILSLRPSALDDLGLAPALRAHAGRILKDTGIQLELDGQGLSRRLPSEIETALFRAFQEALSNVVRHAGARHVRVSLAAHDGVFEGEIADDGRGFNLDEVQALVLSNAKGNGNSPRGLGLLGMQERIAQWGGVLEIRTGSGEGTRLRLRIPMTEAGHD